MKKNMLKVGIFILLAFSFMIIMSKSTFATDIKSVNITVPEPVIGKELATDDSEIQIEGEGEGENDFKFTIKSIEWYRIEWYKNSADGYEKITDLDWTCKKVDKYKMKIEFLFSTNDYKYSTDVTISVNGNKLNKDTDCVLGEKIIEGNNYQSTIVTYDLGMAKVQKEISKIEITAPKLVVGERLDTDVSNYEIKIDDTETIEVKRVQWLSEDGQELENDIVEEGKKYKNNIDFNVPNKYGMSSNVVITINGEEFYYESMKSEEFNYATAGDGEFDYAFISRIIEIQKEVNDEIKDQTNEEEDKKEENDKNESNEQNENENEENKSATEDKNTIKNPKTGDTITVAFIILAVSVLGIVFIIRSNIKQNK